MALREPFCGLSLCSWAPRSWSSRSWNDSSPFPPSIKFVTSTWQPMKYRTFPLLSYKGATKQRLMNGDPSRRLSFQHHCQLSVLHQKPGIEGEA